MGLLSLRWWKGDALPGPPLAHNAVVAVGHDHSHRRAQLCGDAAGIVLERATGFQRADEPAYILVPALPQRKMQRVYLRAHVSQARTVIGR